jgi:hypothetical protein
MQKPKILKKALSIYHDLNNSGTSSDEIQLEIAGNFTIYRLVRFMFNHTKKMSGI